MKPAAAMAADRKSVGRWVRSRVVAAVAAVSLSLVLAGSASAVVRATASTSCSAGDHHMTVSSITYEWMPKPSIRWYYAEVNATPNTSFRAEVRKDGDVQYTVRGVANGSGRLASIPILYTGSQFSYVRVYAFFADGSHCSTANYPI